jgi:signal transduction histidine kinase
MDSLPASHSRLSFDDLAKELEKSRALFEISQALAGTVDLNATLQMIAEAASSLIKTSDRTILHLLDENQRYLQPVAIAGEGPVTPSSPMLFRTGMGIAGQVLATGGPINVPDVYRDNRYLRVGDERKHTGMLTPLRSLLVVPVRTGDKLLGTLSVQSPQVGAFSDDDVRLLTTLGAQAAVAIEKARLVADLQSALEHEKATRRQLVQAEKLAALGRIVASVAHEMNNPLQAIQNALYLIQMEENLSKQAMEDLQTVLNETERMAGMIARLRETYRPATSDEFVFHSVNTIVDEVHRLLATHLRHNRVAFQFYPGDDVPNIPMLRDQIKQVILNISLNAVEAMPGGGQITVTTCRKDERQSVLLSIADNGPSIDPKVLPNIFDPFVTTKAREGGTGLGLAITYDIVQRHLGTIEVDSKPGKGTTFHVWLPYEPRVPTMVHEDERWG